MAPTISTPLSELLDIDIPVIQTAMGWVATPELTAATCNAGAIGFLATASLVPAEVDAALKRVRELTDRPFGVNVLMDAPGADLICEKMIENGVRVASYNRAPNPAMIQNLKDHGMLCIPTIGAAKHAIKAMAMGADAVIVQGGEGGGHTGPVPTSLLIPQVVEAVDGKIPVIAAGGFRDGAGLIAALAWGASGIAMGTRFLMTKESPILPATEERYLQATVNDIYVSTAIDGLPQRCIENELLRKLQASGPITKLLIALENALEYRKTSGASILEILSSGLKMRKSQGLSLAQVLLAANAPMLAKKAMVEGDPKRGYLPSGQVAGLIDDRPSVAELIDRIRNEALVRLDALAALTPPRAK
jgi:NAD(P)H-dependent flavin oxidoreductase YrpB (nitropropane dioxygenase family)